ncbi:hypothetical protein [Lachnoclostridium phytofermentans]|uniref:Uncharacterized protein n=1 Tax=Lachnoclostridium phytofermentans (strain ATCC 700394 / DSM 18823 / ISDg) TaxID=357809 RepID=A9KSF0_LACP7|nr:hypothetical protein [Lachnoclostridium phytofermentans]ABX42182.1 hypothetical protein Cphy_1813 [Lachnoclostridium phytofermentans ISDg]
MYSTEKYEISFAGVRDNRFNLNAVTSIWRLAANTAEGETGLYINAQIEERNLVCHNCCVSEIAIVATVVRNPISEPNDNFFYEVLQHVVDLIRETVGNVSTTIIKALVEVAIR